MEYYYVSIPYYDHKVYKCSGMAPDQAHKDFYIPYYQLHGNAPCRSRRQPCDHVHKVLITQEYIADRINEDLTPFINN